MKVGLVLSGGMAKGAYQVGALKAISNYIPREDIVCISCASIGTLNGYSYAMNKLDEAERMWKSICIEDNRLFISQVLRSCILQEDIKDLYSPEDKFSHDFFVSLLDSTHMKLNYKNMAKEDPSKYSTILRASVAMPFYNPSVKINGNTYYDGAMIDNIPVYPLIRRNLDYIICVYFDTYTYRFESKAFDSKVIQITFPNENFIKQSLIFTKDNIDHMIEKGYDHTNFLLNEVMGNDHTDLERIRRGIKHRNYDNTIRITGDVLTTNFNKFAKKLVRKDIG